MRVIQADDCPRRKLVVLLEDKGFTAFETVRGEVALDRLCQYAAIVEICLTKIIGGEGGKELPRASLDGSWVGPS